MPTIDFEGEQIACDEGDNLRHVLMRHGAKLYHGPMRVIHCRGLGTCGTCALRLVSGELSPPTTVERWRLNFPPHRHGIEQGLRLACQSKVLGDLRIEKLPGWWGQKS